MLAFCMQCQHNAGMPSITIRNIPDEVRNELAARAARTGRSLQEYLRAELVQLAARPTNEELMARIRARVERDGTHLTRAQILRYRDMDRK